MALFAAGLVLGTTGCDRSCLFVSRSELRCEAEQWPRSLATVHYGGRWEPGPRAAWTDPDAVNVNGTADDGANWALAAVDEVLILGRPEAQDVVFFDARPEAIPTVTDEVRVRQRGVGAFGTAVAAGDVDGDGEWDLLVGAPETDLAAGSVYLYLSAAREPPLPDDITNHRTAPALTLLGAHTSDRLGTSIARCGGTEPYWVFTAPRAEGDATLAGKVYVIDEAVLASLEGPVAIETVAHTLWGPAYARFGHALDCRSDLDGTGRNDLVVGAPWAGDGATGAVYVVLDGRFQGAGPTSQDASGAVAVGSSGDWFGYAVATADIDPLSPGVELLVGAPGTDDGAGRVQVLSTDLTPIRAYTSAASAVGEHLGWSIAVGDIDAQGLEDQVFASPTWPGVGAYPGRGHALVLLSGQRDDIGSADVPLPDLSTVRIEGTRTFQRVGYRTLVHDFTGDDAAELVVTSKDQLTAPYR